MYSTLEPYLNLSIFIDFTKLLNSWIQYSTSAFDPLVMSNPSSMYRLKNIDHTILESLMTFLSRKSHYLTNILEGNIFEGPKEITRELYGN